MELLYHRIRKHQLSVWPVNHRNKSCQKPFRSEDVNYRVLLQLCSMLVGNQNFLTSLVFGHQVLLKKNLLRYLFAAVPHSQCMPLVALVRFPWFSCLRVLSIESIYYLFTPQTQIYSMDNPQGNLPRNQLDKVFIQSNSCFGIKDAWVGVSNEISRHNVIFSIPKVIFQFRTLGCCLHHILDLLIRCLESKQNIEYTEIEITDFKTVLSLTAVLIIIKYYYRHHFQFIITRIIKANAKMKNTQ